MKPFLFLLILTSLSASAFADSFSIVKDGKNYLCTSTQPTNPEDRLQCESEAYSGPFDRDQARRLCAGNASVAPAKCGASAYSGPFDKEQAIELCTGAYSEGPSDCAKSAYSGPFDKAQAITLCKRTGTLATAECAKKAYSGPYSKEEAIRLCKAEPNLMLRSLKLMEQSAEIQFKVQQLKSIK